jgi:hypothetical protein
MWLCASVLVVYLGTLPNLQTWVVVETSIGTNHVISHLGFFPIQEEDIRYRHVPSRSSRVCRDIVSVD